MPSRRTAETHVALLRGINVGGRHTLRMARLVSLFEDAGCARVRTYIQSGNVVFEAPTPRARLVPAAVMTAIATELGIDVPIVTRTATELERIVGANPFVAPGTDLRLLHVGFLADRPIAARRVHAARGRALSAVSERHGAYKAHQRLLRRNAPDGDHHQELAHDPQAPGAVPRMRNARTSPKQALRLLRLPLGESRGNGRGYRDRRCR